MKKLAVLFLSLCLILCACGEPAPEKAESFVCGTGARQCFAMSGDTLISAAGNGVRGFDLMGEPVFDIQSDMVYPAVCSNGSDALIYDVGGSGIVYGDGSLLSFENIIISASLSEGGCLAVCAEEPGYKGDQTDIVRRFHLNCAVDTATPYMSPEELDTPLDPEADTRYEETLFSQRQDSFTMEDICGFRGPSVVYLVRELVSPCEEEVCVQLGHSAPVALWINGQLVAERTGCDCWDAENIHVQHIPIHQGVNRVILRLTRVNGDAKFNLTFATGACCASHILHYSSVNPRFFGGR